MNYIGTFVAFVEAVVLSGRCRKIVLFRHVGTKAEGAKAFLEFIEKNPHLAKLPSIAFHWTPESEYVGPHELSELAKSVDRDRAAVKPVKAL